VIARLRTPLGGLLHAAATGSLSSVGPLEWSPDAAVTVVVAAKGYPQSPRTGDPVEGLGAGSVSADSYVLHAGTRLDPDGRTVSAGGRVLSAVGTGPDVRTARDRAYAAVDGISLDGGHWRRDIAAGV
jgi:phosphoribosylamine--glycine ligase